MDLKKRGLNRFQFFVLVFVFVLLNGNFFDFGRIVRTFDFGFLVLKTGTGIIFVEDFVFVFWVWKDGDFLGPISVSFVHSIDEKHTNGERY